MTHWEQFDGYGPEPSSLVSLSTTSYEMTGTESYCPEQIVRCRTLCAAILQHVIQDLRGEGVTKWRNSREAKLARQFLRGAAIGFVMDDSREAFSFEWLCEQMDVDVEWFRREVKFGRVLAWRAKKAEKSEAGTFILRHI